MRGHLARRLHTRRLRPAELFDRLVRGDVEKVDGLRFMRREREVPADHHALGHRRVAVEAEFGGNHAFVHLPRAGKRRLLAVKRDPPPGDFLVLEGSPEKPGGSHRMAVVAEPRRAAIGELDHLGELGSLLPFADGGEESDGDLGLDLGPLDQRPEHGRRVDDGFGVGHREDRAVPTGRCRAGAGCDVLLVLPAGSPQVHVRVHERRRHDLPVRPPATRLEARDDALLDLDGQDLVDPLCRVDDANALEDEIVLAAVPSEQHLRHLLDLGDLDLDRAMRQEVVENRHSHDEAAPHLALDQRLGRVRHGPVDLDPAVHRPGVHDLLPRAQALGRHPPARGVLAQAGHVVGTFEHALALHAQDVHDVGVTDRVDRVRDLAAERLDPAGDERRRPDERHPRTHERERLDVRARDTRMEHVPDDRHVHARDPAELLVDRVEVEQGLGRMLVRPVARVDDVRLRPARDDLGCADVRVADDDDVRVVGADRDRGVLERLALVDRRARCLDRHHVGGESFCGELEARRRPRGGLEEEIDDGAAP